VLADKATVGADQYGAWDAEPQEVLLVGVILDDSVYVAVKELEAPPAATRAHVVEVANAPEPDDSVLAFFAPLLHIAVRIE
jgi:hypothetical protein